MKLKNAKLVEKIVNYLLNVLIFLFGVILIISIYTGVQTKLLRNDYTDFFGYSIFEVQTGSMEESISAGDWIIVKLTQNVKLKDVITYKLDNDYITHRVIEVYNGTYITKGDANNAKDNPVDQTQIVGKVVKVLGNLGILRKTLFNPAVLFTLIVTLFLFNVTIKKNKEDEEKNNGKEENIYLLFDKLVLKLKPTFLKIKGLVLEKVKKVKLPKKTKSLEEFKKENKDTYAVKPIIEENSLFNKVNGVSNEATKEELKMTEEELKKEEELAKTSFFRVVSVDSNEVEEVYKEPEMIPEDLNSYEFDDEDVDKTSFYRVIPVDISEIDKTLLEIADNELKSSEKENKKKTDIEPEIVIEDEPVDEELTKINFEMVKGKLNSQKSKNIIETAINIKKEELNELLEVLVDEKVLSKDISTKNLFINTYINAKYYNYFGTYDSELNNKSSLLKIKKLINIISEDTKKNYKGSNKKHDEVVDIYNNVFILIANLDSANDLVEDVKARNEFYKKEILKFSREWNTQKSEFAINKIIQIQKKYDGVSKYFIKRLETNMFNLNFNKINTKKDMYALDLIHNITFSKVYSEYVIDKTYNEGIIAEDKMSVLMTLLSLELIKDMTSSNYNKKYILNIPNTLYEKEKKFLKLLKSIDDKYAKENVIILTSFDNLVKSKVVIKELRKLGYKFACYFNSNSVVKDKSRSALMMLEYLFIDKKLSNLNDIVSSVPSELLDNIIYDDIEQKVGNNKEEQ